MPTQKEEQYSGSDMVLPEDEQKEFEKKMDHYLFKGNNLPKYFNQDESSAQQHSESDSDADS